MPAFATHFFYAEKVYESLDEDTQKKIKKYRDYYDLGAQGPDIFYYYKPYRKNNISDFGTQVHHKLFKELIKNALKNIKEYEMNPNRKLRTYEDDAALIYLLGLSTHFTLDSSFHPLINKEAKTKNDHYILETELDRKIIEREAKNIEPYKFKRNLLINYKVKKYGKELNLVYPEVSSRTIDEVVYQTNFYIEKLSSPSGFNTKMISTVSKWFAGDGTDFSNMIIKKEVNHKFDKVISRLLENYDETIELGKANLINILEHYDGKGKLSHNFNKSFE